MEVRIFNGTQPTARVLGFNGKAIITDYARPDYGGKEAGWFGLVSGILWGRRGDSPDYAQSPHIHPDDLARLRASRS